jgi:CheY-like chemotaxis protein
VDETIGTTQPSASFPRFAGSSRTAAGDGFSVLSAADGYEGLELSRQYPGRIDLVITDQEMPRLSGTTLCAHLLQERPGIKVLIMSGADILEMVSQNANLPFLPKPFDGEALAGC